jgi:hypothetical protein
MATVSSGAFGDRPILSAGMIAKDSRSLGLRQPTGRERSSMGNPVKPVARSLDACSFVQEVPDSRLEPVLKALHEALAPIVDRIEKRPLN